MEDYEYLKSIFEGSDLAHGRTIIIGEREDGKLDTKSWLVHKPATDNDWKNHVEGKAGIGLSPITSKSEVKWGCIDIDEYKGKLDLSVLAKQFKEDGLPLVVARSKSGGAHLMLFVDSWLSASIMMMSLEGISAHLGFAKCEIFPKQAKISTEKGDGHCDYGNWLNLPYFNGIQHLRYILDDTGSAISSIKEAYEFVQTKKISKEQLANLKLESKTTLFNDGPPCLDRIFEADDQQFRNITLCNVAVYLKKKYNDDWKDKLDAYNAKFSTPLPSSEVEAIKRSYDKKDYNFQCSKSPLCNFCNSSLCRQKDYGVGQHNNLPNRRSLTKICSEPPVWLCDVQTDKGIKRISLETAELVNLNLFRLRCVEVTNTLPAMMKQAEWDEFVHAMMENLTEIPAPKELTPEGQLAEHLHDFFHKCRNQKEDKASFEDLLIGLAYKNVEGYHFRIKDLDKFLKKEKFIIKQNKLATFIKTTFSGQRSVKKISGRSTNCWTFNADQFEKEVSKLTTHDYEQSQPY
jgi:hypothetical protein